MSKVHGIVYAYHSSPRLGDLTRYRTNASLPFCGRYRLIDFALSSLSNAGVHSVGVIMQRDYQSLLDHLGSGKAWDLSRRSGGLHLLPPFGVNTRGDYTGTAEALNAVIPTCAIFRSRRSCSCRRTSSAISTLPPPSRSMTPPAAASRPSAAAAPSQGEHHRVPHGRARPRHEAHHERVGRHGRRLDGDLHRQ